MNNDLITVVIPVYNVEKYLSRSIDSVVSQTYTNLEILLIDDCSTDGCAEICDNYALKDQRIRVIHKENAGLGMARNTGIENACGKYIFFFDSDDYVEKNVVEECYLCATEEKADMVCFGHIEEFSNGDVIENRIPQPKKDVFRNEEIKNWLMPMTLSHDASKGEHWHLSLSAWCAMFSMEVIKNNNWRFVSERDIISEDIYSVLEYYSFTSCVAFIRKSFYHYVSNPLSLSKAYRKDRYEKLKILAGKLTELSVEMNMPDLLEERVRTIFLGLTIGAMKQIAASEEKIDKMKELKAIINDSYMQTVLSKNDFSGENFSKRLLFYSMCNKMTWLCYFLLKVKIKISS